MKLKKKLQQKCQGQNQKLKKTRIEMKNQTYKKLQLKD